MAKIKAFRGLRPKIEFCEKVASPPYDVLNSDEARELTRNNPNSFLHIIKPEIDLPKDVNLYDKKVYVKGAENLRKFQKENILIQDEVDSYYVYKQIMKEHHQVGLVAVASIEDYKNNIIKKHELTRADKEEDRTKHVNTLNANAGPVFLTYKSKASIDKIIDNSMKEKPLYQFQSDDGIQHILWKISDEEIIQKITDEFQKIDYLYVADGHHRSAAATRVADIRTKENPNHTGNEEYNFFLTVIFPANQMHIMDYNRVVNDLNNYSISEFIKICEEKFEISFYDTNNVEQKHYKPKQKHEFGMYLDGKWYKLSARPESFPETDPVNSLDVAILQNNLLVPILNIGDLRKDKRINFVGGIRGLGELEKLVNSGKYRVAFSMFPTSIGELMDVADAGKTMPPKSTWFEPKLRSGLITHLLS